MIETTYINLKDRPVQITFTVSGVAKSVVVMPKELFDASFYGADPGSIMVEGTEFNKIVDSSRPINILKKAAYLDYETRGVKAGSVITEASVYRADTDVLDVFYIKPYQTTIAASTDEELVDMTARRNRFELMLKTRPREQQSGMFAQTLTDEFRKALVGGEASDLVKSVSKLEDENSKAVLAILNADNLKSHEKLESLLKLDNDKKIFQEGTALSTEVQKFLVTADPFQARQYVSGEEQAKAIGLRGSFTRTDIPLDAQKRNQQIFGLIDYLRDFGKLETESGRQDYARKLTNFMAEEYGTTFSQVNVHAVDVEEFFHQRLPSVLKGYNVQIANALFESKQTGAVLRSIEALKLLEEGQTVEDPIKFNKLISTRLMGNHPFQGTIEGISYTGDPFYVTGQEYNKQKARATIGSNYSGMTEHYVGTTGPGSVRDVQDLMKTTQSQLYDMAVSTNRKPSALSVEVQARIFGAVKGENPQEMISALLEKESHLSAPDAAISTKKILEESLEMTLAGNEMLKQTALGEHYLRQARKGEGPAFKLMMYGAIFNKLNEDLPNSPGLNKIMFRQRMARNLESLLDPTRLNTFRNVEAQRTHAVLHRTDAGDVPISTNIAKFKTYVGQAGLYEPAERIAKEYGIEDGVAELNNFLKEIDQATGGNLFEFNKDMDQYRIKTNKEAVEKSFEEAKKKLKTQIEESKITGKEYASGLRKILEEKYESFHSLGKLLPYITGTAQSREAQISAFEARFGSNPEEVFKRIRGQAKEYANQIKIDKSTKITSRSATALEQLDLSAVLRKTAPKYLGAVGVVYGMSHLDINKPQERKSVLSPTFDQWFKNQSVFFGSDEAFQRSVDQKYGGNIEGMNESGIGASIRKMMSDFGSPYQGPEYSMGVMENMEYIRERERMVQNNYHIRHNTYEGDIYQLLRSFVSNSMTPPEFRLSTRIRPLLGTGEDFDKSKYKELSGSNLVKMSVTNDYRISVEDADTITLQRTGGAGPLASFMGSGAKYSLRFAGIDAPETSHGGRGAQPYAEAAKRIAADMINKAKNVEVVFDPSDTTYGRRVAMIYADGKNVNLELIKRGAAAYLPYRSNTKEKIYNQEAFKEAQERAQAGNVGMWSTDYFRAYAEIMNKTNQSITFNTLVNATKVATNTKLMDVASTMNLANEMGMENAFVKEQIVNTEFAIKNAGGAASVFKADMNKYMWNNPVMGHVSSNSATKFNTEIMEDIKASMRDRESDIAQRLSSRKILDANRSLAKNINEKSYLKPVKDIKKQEANRNRLLIMEAMQQRANKDVFKNRNSHHRM